MDKEKSNKRKSFIISFIIHLGLLMIIFVFGMSYYDPPLESGIAINFGYVDNGMGNDTSISNAEPPPVVEEEDESVEKSVSEEAVESIEEEEVINQDIEDAPVINNDNNEINESKEDEKEIEEKLEEKVDSLTEKKEEITKPPQPSQETKSAIANLINSKSNNDEEKGTGDGTGNVLGNQGSEDGDESSNNYFGKGGNDNGTGNYQLGNRRPLDTPKPEYECNEEGVVVVRIIVDRKGKVMEAYSGARGTTNAHPCLLEKAKSAALNTPWEEDESAPVKQSGKIIYKFSLTK